jgi:hypothetical protein
MCNKMLKFDISNLFETQFQWNLLSPWEELVCRDEKKKIKMKKGLKDKVILKDNFILKENWILFTHILACILN